MRPTVSKTADALWLPGVKSTASGDRGWPMRGKDSALTEASAPPEVAITRQEAAFAEHQGAVERRDGAWAMRGLQGATTG